MPEIKRYCGGHTTMLLKKLKDFHERTMEQYKEEENLEPWKKKVMELHEKSAFLFYYDATLEENAEQNSEHSTHSDRVTNIGYYFFWGAVFGCRSKIRINLSGFGDLVCSLLGRQLKK